MAEETKQERLNRELIELLNELRVVLPGVQVLFAFLLTIPFSKGFSRLDRAERDVYFAALVAAVVSSILLIAPSAYHRVLFRHHDKEYLIERATRMALIGTAALAVSVSCAVFLIADFVFGGLAAGLAAALVVGLSLTLWFVLPLRRRAQLEHRSGSDRVVLTAYDFVATHPGAAAEAGACGCPSRRFEDRRTVRPLTRTPRCGGPPAARSFLRPAAHGVP